jgi:hypothetical protein
MNGEPMPRTMPHRTAALVATGLLLGTAGQQSASGGTPQHIGYRSLLSVAATSAIADPEPLPPNLFVPPSHDKLVSEMWRRSATFRRQGRRIAEDTGLVVRVHLNPLVPGESARATTRVTRQVGSLAADVSIRDTGCFVELLAHELEHVLEQLDRIDLAAAAQRPGRAVWVAGDGSFETIRAIHVGRQVAAEVQGVGP